MSDDLVLDHQRALRTQPAAKIVGARAMKQRMTAPEIATSQAGFATRFGRIDNRPGRIERCLDLARV